MHCGSALKRKGGTEVRLQELPEGAARNLAEVPDDDSGFPEVLNQECTSTSPWMKPRTGSTDTPTM